MITKEEWRDIEDYKGLYQVSSEGRVRGLDRYVHNCRAGYKKWFAKGKVLKLSKDKDGYNIIALSKGDKKEGRKKTKKVHRLVAITFIENKRNLPVTNHINSVRNDNRVSNLEWTTYSDNQRHAYRQGHKNTSGENQPRSILKNKDVCEIVHMVALGVLQKDIAKKYGVHFGIISSIVTGKAWTSVTPDVISDLLIAWAEGVYGDDIFERLYKIIKRLN